MSQLMFDQNMSEPVNFEFDDSKVVAFSKKCELSKNNQDSVGIFSTDKGSLVIGLADGAGGHKSGAEASRIVIEELKTINRSLIDSRLRRLEIIEAFESSNKKLLDTYPGAASTLVVAEIDKNSCKARVYFAGDSIALVIGGRGKLKYRTYGHNPVDLGIQAGILEELLLCLT